MPPLHPTAYCLFASSLVGYTTIQISTDNRAMDEVWTCQFCSAVFHRLDHHKRHIATHSSQKPFKCGFCGSHYKRGDVLRRHWKSCSARIHAGQAIPGPRIGGKERHACDVCARLKKSCDGGKPCLECATRRKECTYLRLQESGGSPRNQHTPSPTFNKLQPEPINSIPDVALPTWDLGLQPYYPNHQTRLKARALRDGIQSEG